MSCTDDVIQVVCSFVGDIIVYVSYLYQGKLYECFDVRDDIGPHRIYPMMYASEIPQDVPITEHEQLLFARMREGTARKLDEQLKTVTHLNTEVFMDCWLTIRNTTTNESKKT